LIGKIEETEKFQGEYLDLRNKTDLMDLLYIFQNNKSFICLDSGLYHLAMMTEIKIVCCFTNIRPDLRLPPDNNVTVIETQSGCKYCGTDMYYMNIPKESCVMGKDYECCKGLNIEEIIRGLNEQCYCKRQNA
jgi:ADP-heptose:LPS heptosyltransferase